MTAVLRPAATDDLPKLATFAHEAGVGFTSLPTDHTKLAEKIDASLAAFSSEKPNHETYLFCLELEGNVIGTCALISRIGVDTPFHAYHLLYEKQQYPPLNIDRDIPVLHPIQAEKKPTEIATLFLEKPYRGKGFSKLLSFSRFLFLATFPQRFAPIVIAELRGLVNKTGASPFWNAVGKHFFNLSFPEADTLRATRPDVLEALFPQHPIYPMLLPPAAHAAIGQTHPLTTPAYKLLRQQGFQLSDYYDIFDGGPHLYAPTHDIQAVKESRGATIAHIHTGAIHSRSVLITNTRLDFRACLALIEGENDITISEETAHALNVTQGDKVRYLCL